MSNLEKAFRWFQENGHEVTMDDNTLYIVVWNTTLEESIDVQVSTAEIDYRAELWQSLQTNQN
jgi:hypothetical protein